MSSIKEIETEFKACERSERRGYIRAYADVRSGVQKLIKKYQADDLKYQQELDRLEQMKVYEKKYGQYLAICGIDEVGRGPLAGPVTAGAVILPKDVQILYLNDSKKLSPKKREELAKEIREKAIAVGLGMVSPERIDQINILQATYEAMRMAISNLEVRPDLLLNDAVDDSGSGGSAGADHQGGCEKCFDCSGKYCGEGRTRSSDGRI